MPQLDVRTAQCLIYTYKEGLLSLVAHDLKLRVTRFSIDVDRAAGKVEARFDAGSLVVDCAMRDGREAPAALSAKDRRDIEENVAKDVLDPRRFPDIRFASERVVVEADGARVAGRLVIKGRERSLELSARRQGEQLVLETRLHQPDYGIKPFSAILGTLRIKPDITVRLVVPAAVLAP